MSVTDRIREIQSSPVQETGNYPTVTESTTLVVADPTSRRISGLLRELGVLFKGMSNKDWITRQMGIIIDAIREEVEDDADLFAGPSAQAWIVQFSRLMEWTGTGDYSSLPPDLIPIACAIDGIPAPPAEEPLFEYEADHPALAGQLVKVPHIDHD